MTRTGYLYPAEDQSVDCHFCQSPGRTTPHRVHLYANASIESYNWSDSVSIHFCKYSGGICMRQLSFVLLLLCSFLLAQESSSSSSSQHNSETSNAEITVQGCVGRSSGDFVLMKLDPGMTYQLHATGKIRLKHYLGQQVEVTGRESPSLSTSSNSSGRMGSPSVALTITSITTVEKRCSAQ